jgi:hypothetical protein
MANIILSIIIIWQVLAKGTAKEKVQAVFTPRLRSSQKRNSGHR